jgi:hypothetical protein
MHVVDIEQRFEQLTKINPKLSKSEIVAQIKEFIKATHEKIKSNYSKSRKAVNKSSLINNIDNYEKLNEESKNENKNEYEGILKLPDIKNNRSISFLSQNKQNIFEGESNVNKSENLPILDK